MCVGCVCGGLLVTLPPAEVGSVCVAVLCVSVCVSVLYVCVLYVCVCHGLLVTLPPPPPAERSVLCVVCEW